MLGLISMNSARACLCQLYCAYISCVAVSACTEIASPREKAGDTRPAAREEKSPKPLPSTSLDAGMSSANIARAIGSYRRLYVPSKDHSYNRFGSGVIRSKLDFEQFIKQQGSDLQMKKLYTADINFSEEALVLLRYNTSSGSTKVNFGMVSLSPAQPEDHASQLTVSLDVTGPLEGNDSVGFHFFPIAVNTKLVDSIVLKAEGSDVFAASFDDEPRPIAVASWPGPIIPLTQPAPPDPKRMISRKALEAARTRGKAQIFPSAPVQKKVTKTGKAAVALWKVCVSEQGRVSTAMQVKASGFPGYDRQIKVTIKQWRFGREKGTPLPGCSKYAFVAPP